MVLLSQHHLWVLKVSACLFVTCMKRYQLFIQDKLLYFVKLLFQNMWWGDWVERQKAIESTSENAQRYTTPSSPPCDWFGFQNNSFGKKREKWKLISRSPSFWRHHWQGRWTIASQTLGFFFSSTRIGLKTSKLKVNINIDLKFWWLFHIIRGYFYHFKILKSFCDM